MSDLHRVNIETDAHREPTAAELAGVPVMTPRERTEAMNSEEYRKSSLVRRLVAESIRKSDPMQSVDDGPEEQPFNLIEAKQAAVQRLFRDPRYKVDAAYRFEVQQQLAAFTAGDNAALSGESAYTPNQTFSISTSKSPFHGADLRVRKFARVELAPNETGPNAPEKK